MPPCCLVYWSTDRTRNCDHAKPHCFTPIPTDPEHGITCFNQVLSHSGSAQRRSIEALGGCSASSLHTSQEADPACPGRWWLARDRRKRSRARGFGAGPRRAHHQENSCPELVSFQTNDIPIEIYTYRRPIGHAAA